MINVLKSYFSISRYFTPEPTYLKSLRGSTWLEEETRKRTDIRHNRLGHGKNDVTRWCSSEHSDGGLSARLHYHCYLSGSKLSCLSESMYLFKWYRGLPEFRVEECSERLSCGHKNTSFIFQQAEQHPPHGVSRSEHREVVGEIRRGTWGEVSMWCGWCFEQGDTFHKRTQNIADPDSVKCAGSGKIVREITENSMSDCSSRTNLKTTITSNNPFTTTITSNNPFTTTTMSNNPFEVTTMESPTRFLNTSTQVQLERATSSPQVSKTSCLLIVVQRILLSIAHLLAAIPLLYLLAIVRKNTIPGSR